jgi:hypothetical protein
MSTSRPLPVLVDAGLRQRIDVYVARRRMEDPEVTRSAVVRDLLRRALREVEAR